MKILTFTLALSMAAMACSAADAKSKKKLSGTKPSACERYSADPMSLVQGPWILKQRDDASRDWAGPWNIDLKSDGTWTLDREPRGYWCNNGNTLFFGFSKNPHTTYRGAFGENTVQGTQSWNNGGTGLFEMTRPQ